MYTLSLRNPLQQLEDLQNRLTAFFRHTPIDNGNGKEAQPALAQWTPAVDISEDDKEFLIKTELPDVKKEDVKVSVAAGVLTIQGERKQEKEEKNVRHHRIDRSYGSFVRSFTLPETTDGQNITASYANGVLILHLPKNPKAEPKALEIPIK